MEKQNFYQLLGIDKYASFEKIKKAYREKVHVWHPDRNSHQIDKAEEMTKLLNMAYSILRDPKKRRNYDNMLRYSQNHKFDHSINEKTFWKNVQTASGTLYKIVDNVKNLFFLFNDVVRGKYKVHPITLGLVSGALFYFILPFDLLPDFLPFAGFFDDLTVFSTIIVTIQKELDDYYLWKNNLKK